ncbi:MAG TPA: flagellar hook-associated protein FlgK [Acidobacteriota bacterium]|nr:flagellar hook-associated protein FlgK [Acidobacteriota bacterium]
MGGIFGALQIGLRNLSNAQAGIFVVNENVANVNVEGYSRRRVIYQPGPYEQRPYGLIGSGAEIQRIESVRDVFLEARLLLEHQATGFFAGQEYGVTQLEPIMNISSGQGVSDEMSKFFDAFLELASDPSSLSLRQVALAQADALASRIRTTASQLGAVEENLRMRTQDLVNDVNGLLHRIAAINTKLQPMLSLGQDGGPLYDERQKLLNELARKIDIQVQTDQSGNMVLTTGSGRLLLMGDEANELSFEATASDVIISLQGEDITSEIQKGELGGLLAFQTGTLSSVRNSLNTLTKELADAVNAVHQAGVDLDGEPGGVFFSTVAGQEARTISVAVMNFRDIAAAEPGAGIGNGSNAQAIADLRDKEISELGGQTLTEYFSQIVFEVGLAGQTVRSSLDLQTQMLRQLENQRESVSGVSLDEEAITLIQLQRSYEASARLIRVLDTLLEETINLVRS